MKSDFDQPCDPVGSRTRQRRALTLGVMVVGYSGFFLCRSNLAVTMPQIIDDLAASGIDPKAAKLGLGSVASAGILAYAVGKLPGGGLADFLGGRRVLLGGMAGAILFTLLFATGGSIPLFTMAWVGNRAFQSIGWPGVIKLISRWFPASGYGMAMGIMSLAFLWGDSAARYGMGLLIANGVGWRGVFYAGAAIFTGLLVFSATFLRESPGELGLEEPRANPSNVFGEEGSDPTPPGLGALLIPLFRSPVFGMVCLLSFGLTLLRETFNTWTATYFVEGVGMDKGRAAGMSSLFPLLGGFSVLLAGYLGDRAGTWGRAAIVSAGMVLTTVALVALASIDPRGSNFAPVALVSLIGFLLIGPYSYLAGAISLDLGGKRGGATTCGIVDFVGYLGGVLAGRTMAGISNDYGWKGAFLVLAAVAGGSALAAGALIVVQRRRPPLAD